MLDSSRHFQPIEYVKRVIDRMALAKLNTFHWHLTDDQGWRIEIDRYPKLTSVGAWRQPAGAAGVDANGRPVRYGGFYTKDEIRDLVPYAAARPITIVQIRKAAWRERSWHYVSVTVVAVSLKKKR